MTIIELSPVGTREAGLLTTTPVLIPVGTVSLTLRFTSLDWRGDARASITVALQYSVDGAVSWRTKERGTVNYGARRANALPAFEDIPIADLLYNSNFAQKIVTPLPADTPLFFRITVNVGRSVPSLGFDLELT